MQVSSDSIPWIQQEKAAREARKAATAAAAAREAKKAAAAAVAAAARQAQLAPPSAKYIGSSVEDPTGRHLGIIQASVGPCWRLHTNMQLKKTEENAKWRLGPCKLEPGFKVKVIVSPSVAYRHTPTPQDLKKPDQVESYGSIITVVEWQGDWVRGAKGWLPMRAPTTTGKTELLQWADETEKIDKPVAREKEAEKEAEKEVEEWNEDWWVFSMLKCRVCLGNPYLIEGNLMKPDGMHDLVWCTNPEDELETLAEEWDVAHGHDSYFVKGQEGHQAGGRGVHNNEYIVFHPFQVLPLYKVDYTIS